MKWIVVLLMSCSLNVAAQTRWRPDVPATLFAPVAAKCDLSVCQQNCYVQQSQCKNSGEGACGSLAQICVQNCSSQCR